MLNDNLQLLLYMLSCESFLKVKGVWWICCTEKNVCVLVGVCSEIGKEKQIRTVSILLPPPLPSCKTWKLVAYRLQNDEKY